MSAANPGASTPSARTPPSLTVVALVGLTAVLTAFAILEALIVLPAAAQQPDVTIGFDVRPYIAQAQVWLNGGSFYLERQLTGQSYVITSGDVLYPPPILYLLVPFALGVPMALWWAIPIAVGTFAVIRSRPELWALPILAAAFCYPRTWTILVLGNPAMWAIAAAMAGAVWGWPAIGALIKPTLAPLALVGVRHRSWWIGLAVAIALSIPFWAMWVDFFTAVVNAHNTRGVEYPLGEWPTAIALVLVPMSRSLTDAWRRRQAGVVTQ